MIPAAPLFRGPPCGLWFHRMPGLSVAEYYLLSVSVAHAYAAGVAS